MNDTKEPSAGQWTSTQAYVLSVICLMVGVAVGYLVRGSAPSENVLPASANAAGAMQQTSPAGGAPMQPSSEQLRQMADTQAQPLLQQLQSDPFTP